MDSEPPPPVDPPVFASAPEPSPPAPSPPSRLRRRLATAFAVLGALAVALFLAYPRLVRWAVRREAARRGVSLSFASATLDFQGIHPSAVHLRDAHATLDNVGGIAIDAAAIDVQLEAMEPIHVETSGLSVALEGSPTDHLRELVAFTAAHPDLFRAPVTSHGVALRWSLAPGDPPWMAFDHAELTAWAAANEFHAPHATIAGLALGPVAAAWSGDLERVTLGLGSETLREAPIAANLHLLDAAPSLDLTLAHSKITSLAALFGQTAPAAIHAASAEGKVTLAFHDRSLSGAVDATVGLTLGGWTPPHPRELDGILFGSSTEIRATLHLSDDRRLIHVADSRVAAGAFVLNGPGEIVLEPGFATASLHLAGSIGCAALTHSAVTADFGRLAGAIAGGAADMALKGTVRVNVEIEADSRHPEAVNVRHTLSNGCGLRVPTLF